MTTRQVGEVYSPDHARYDEGARYAYSGGAHELVLFWSGPTPAEVDGFRIQPMEVGLFTHGPAAFLLYKIKDVCEWSDVAFNIHLIPERSANCPNETGRSGAFPHGAGRCRGRRDPRQAHRLAGQGDDPGDQAHHARTGQGFNRVIYEAAVQDVYGRYADSDALANVAEVIEPALGRVMLLNVELNRPRRIAGAAGRRPGLCRCRDAGAVCQRRNAEILSARCGAVSRQP
jgi:hypothetical protein